MTPEQRCAMLDAEKKYQQEVNDVVKCMATLRRAGERLGIGVSIGRSDLGAVIYLVYPDGNIEKDMDSSISEAVERDWEDE